MVAKRKREVYLAATNPPVTRVSVTTPGSNKTLFLSLIKSTNIPHFLVHKGNTLRHQKLLNTPRTPKSPKPARLDPSMRQRRLVIYRHSVDMHSANNPLVTFGKAPLLPADTERIC